MSQKKALDLSRVSKQQYLYRLYWLKTVPNMDKVNYRHHPFIQVLSIEIKLDYETTFFGTPCMWRNIRMGHHIVIVLPGTLEQHTDTHTAFRSFISWAAMWKQLVIMIMREVSQLSKTKTRILLLDITHHQYHFNARFSIFLLLL